jgi:hypothetical protein
VVITVLPAFHENLSSEAYLAETARFVMAGFQKFSVQVREIFNRSHDFESPIKRFEQIKTIATARLRTS